MKEKLYTIPVNDGRGHPLRRLFGQNPQLEFQSIPKEACKVYLQQLR